MRAAISALGMMTVLFSTPTWAGFDRWTAKTEDDPFSKGRRITIDFMTSIRSGVLLICDTSEEGFLLRAVPGYAYESTLDFVDPQIEVAIDGEVLFGQQGEAGSVGDNLAVLQVMLSPKNAAKFAEAFATAKKQIALRDGVSDRPYLMSTRGSTKAAQILSSCLNKQIHSSESSE